MLCINKIFTFGHCRERLARPLSLNLKNSFLACTFGVQISDESHKPLQALYNNRQARNVYKYLLTASILTPEYIITGWNGTIPRLLIKAMQVAMRIFIGNNNKTVWGNLFSVIDRYATSNRVQILRFNVYPFLPYLIVGGKGVNLLFTPSINFVALMQVTDLQGGEAISKANKQINSLLPINL